jgi:2-methylcitrate dehydratase
VLYLRERDGVRAVDVDRLQVEIFDVAYNIIGGGEEGEKTVVRRKEEADHSLPYLLAVALLDGQVLPAQYLPDRITRDDVQDLLRRVEVRPDEELSRRFPAEHACRLRLRLRDGRTLAAEKTDYEGFHTRPASWQTAVGKFDALTARWLDADLRGRLVELVAGLETVRVAELADVLRRVPAHPATERQEAPR